MADQVTIQEHARTEKGDSTLERKQFGGVWYVLAMIGYHRGWPEWHWIKEDEYLCSLDKNK